LVGINRKIGLLTFWHALASFFFAKISGAAPSVAVPETHCSIGFRGTLCRDGRLREQELFLARIPLVDQNAMTAEQLKVFAAVTSGPRGALVGPLRAALHRPDLADAWQRFGALLRFGTSLPPILSELAILVTARRWNSQLEWHVHSAAARKAGLPDAVIEPLRLGESPLCDDAEQAEIYEYARQLQEQGQVDDALYDRVLARWGTVGIVELTALIGYYTMVSMTLNAHHIPTPDGAAPLPVIEGRNGSSHAVLAKLQPARLKIESPRGD
jgi:4-carboxymuconolactone decarboxylase